MYNRFYKLEITLESLIDRLRKRASIRRSISTRKSVQNGEPDRIADLLEEAASEIERLQEENEGLYSELNTFLQQDIN